MVMDALYGSANITCFEIQIVAENSHPLVVLPQQTLERVQLSLHFGNVPAINQTRQDPGKIYTVKK
jgi:hypothetical protein